MSLREDGILDSDAGILDGDQQPQGVVDYAARPQGKPAPTVELVRRCWKIILVTLVLSLHADVDTALFPPYFYTRVSCCEMGPGGTGPMLPPVEAYGDHDIKLYITPESCDCDIDKVYGKAAVNPVNETIAACAMPMLDRDSPLWSHSSYCPNLMYVQAQQQTLSTSWTALQNVSALFCLVIFSKVSDVYGRKRVFYWTTVMTIISFAIFTADSAFRLASDSFIYITAPLLATFSTHDAVAWSMAVDLVPDPVDQAAFFPLLTPILNKGVSSLIGDVIAYFLLAAHLTDYTAVWFVLFLVAAAACVFIRGFLEETMPNPKPYPGHIAFLRDVLPCCTQQKQNGDAAALLSAVPADSLGAPPFPQTALATPTLMVATASRLCLTVQTGTTTLTVIPQKRLGCGGGSYTPRSP
jgi:MFS family permease